MNSGDKFARFFVVITFLSFDEAKITGVSVPNLIYFSFLLGAAEYFSSTRRMAEIFS